MSSKNKTDMILLNGAKKVFGSVLFIPISGIRLVGVSGKIKVMYRNTNLKKFDVVLFRVPEQCYENALLIAKNLDVFKIQEPETFEISKNRLLLFKKLAEDKINVPKISYANNSEAAARSFKEMKFPILVRVLGSSKKVMLAESQREAKAMLDTLESLNQPLFLEEYVTGVDLFQIYILGGEVIGTIRKKAGEIEYGKGEYESKRVPRKIRELATSVCHSTGTKIARVDILNLPDPIVVDVNVCPYLDLLEQVSKEDVGRKVMRRVKEMTSVEKGGFLGKLIDDAAKVVLRNTLRV